MTDEEIKVFIALEDEGRFYKDITLETIEAKGAPAKGADNDKSEKREAEPGDADGEGSKVVEITDFTVVDETVDLPASEIGTAEEDTDKD